MIILKIKKHDYFSKYFLKNKVKDLLKKLLINRSIKYNNSKLNTYLNDNYKIDLKKIINIFIKNIHLIETKKEYILELNEFKINDIKLITFINLIDFGNMNIRGINLFNSSLSDLRNNIKVYQKLFLLNPKGDIWQ